MKEGLEHILSRSPDNWLPEDVYHCIKAGTLHLYLGEDEGNLDGFVILQQNNGWNGSEVHIFAVWSKRPDALAYEPQIKEICHKVGAKRLTFVTRRKGWEKTAIQRGYTKDHTAWEVPL